MSQDRIGEIIEARTRARNRGFMAKAGRVNTQCSTMAECVAQETARKAKIEEARKTGKPLYQAVTVTFSDGTMATFYGKAKLFADDTKSVKGWSFTEPSTIPYPYCKEGMV